MLSKFELVGISISVICMALALYLVSIETSILATANPAANQAAQLGNSGVVVVQSGDNVNQQRANALIEATEGSNNLKKLVIEDVIVGEGVEVKEGDTVSVHYVGTLQDGYEFDNSNKRGEPFSFTVGEGRVIKGWEEGLVGMKVGGQRILVIPPEKAYGANGIGPIPGNATLVFSIELLAIN